MLDKEDFDAMGDMFDAKDLPRKLFDRIVTMAETKGGVEVLDNARGRPRRRTTSARCSPCSSSTGSRTARSTWASSGDSITTPGWSSRSTRPRLGAEKQVMGGGSYTLSELFGGEPVFSTGFAIGLDRVVLASEAERPKDEFVPLDVYVVPAGEDMRKYAFGIVARLRSQGLRADVDLMRRSLSKNLKYASSVGREVRGHRRQGGDGQALRDRSGT